jgi:hypothetical protein
MQIRGQEKKRRGWLTGETKSGEGVQGDDGELAPVMNGGDGVVDGVQQMTAVSNPWLVMTIASRGNDEVRLEELTASGGVNGEVLRRKFVRPSVRKSARRRESVRDKRGSAVSFAAWIPTKVGGGLHGFRRGIPAAWRPVSRRGREEKGEGSEGLYRRGLNGQLLARNQGGVTPAAGF